MKSMKKKNLFEYETSSEDGDEDNAPEETDDE